jgi:hypothetical protein
MKLHNVYFSSDIVRVITLKRMVLAFLRVADGVGGIQMWWIAESVLSGQSRIAGGGWSSSLGVGRGGWQLVSVRDRLVVRCYTGHWNW